MADLNWSDAQWQKVKDSVTEAFGKASVASAFLPMYGPLPCSTDTVRNERIVENDPSTPLTVTLDTDHESVNLKLVNLTVRVELTSEQVAEESLSNAMVAFRRAANILAQETDRIVFQGYGRGDPNSNYVANSIRPQKGLADLPSRFGFPDLPNAPSAGERVVSAVIDAIDRLEDSSNPEPFACILGNYLFEEVHRPTPSMVLPADRIRPLLKGGPLLRSGKIDTDDGITGVLVSLAANAIDLVVGTPPTVQFLQRKENARFLFRVYEKFVLRIRDDVTPAVVGFAIRSFDLRVVQALTLELLATKAALVPELERQVAAARTRLAEAERDRG
jgi:uncharacterized linocin/CFP29 family protein